jgi:hypothetical protein
MKSGPGSSVGIATELRAGRSGDRILVGTRFSATVQTGPGAHPAYCTMGTGSFLGGKERPGRDADPSPPSSAVVKKEYSYTSTPPMGRTACKEPQCLYSTAIPVLPLGVVRPVQSRSACTVQLDRKSVE